MNQVSEAHSIAELDTLSSAPAPTTTEPRTLGDLIRRSLEIYDLPDALNYKEADSWKAIASAELVSRAENIALGLYSVGVRKGDRAAILAPNSPKWTLTDAGCQFAGIIDVPIYTTLAVESVHYIVNDAQTRVFCLQDEEAYRRVRPAVESCKCIEKF